MHNGFRGDACRGNATSDDVILHLRDTAFSEARRVRLNEEEAHDCAMEMVLHALLQAVRCRAANLAEGMSGDTHTLLPTVSLSLFATHLILRADLCPAQTAKWLRRCARNFALNYRRRIDARRRHEVEPQENGSEESLAALAVPPAESDALNRLLHQDVFAAMQELPPHARAVFARFHFQGESIAEIALSSGKSPDVVKKNLQRMRHQVRARLVQKGYEAEAANGAGGAKSPSKNHS